MFTFYFQIYNFYLLFLHQEKFLFSFCCSSYIYHYKTLLFSVYLLSFEVEKQMIDLDIKFLVYVFFTLVTLFYNYSY